MCYDAANDVLEMRVLLIKSGEQVMPKFHKSSTIPTITVDRSELRTLLTTIKGGEYFGVVFIKKSSNEERKMLCQLSVTKHLKGGKEAYNAEAKDLVRVYSKGDAGYRCFAVDSITEMRLRGKRYYVRAEKVEG